MPGYTYTLYFSSVDLMAGRLRLGGCVGFMILYKVKVGPLSALLCADVDTTFYKPVFD